MVDPPVPTQASAPVGSSSASKGRVCPQCKTAAASATEVFCPRDGAYFVEVADLEASESDPLLGKRVADFAVVARIGSGGMGTVYRALQVGMDRQVALKVLRAELADNPQVVQRFLQEAKASAKLQHRNLAITYTSGSTPDGLFFIAMEYIPGRSLTQLIERSWVTDPASGHTSYALEPARALRLFSQIVSALAHAHRLGIVHRDLKPDNVLIMQDPDEGEQAKVVDFGIAKLLQSSDGAGNLVKTEANANLGTALYMAPERFAGAPSDPRLDVYALGLLLHEMLLGLLPFATRYEDRELAAVLLHKRLTMAVPSLPTGGLFSMPLSTLHSDLLDREPLRRPASAIEVRDRLREIPELSGGIGGAPVTRDTGRREAFALPASDETAADPLPGNSGSGLAPVPLGELFPEIIHDGAGRPPPASATSLRMMRNSQSSLPPVAMPSPSSTSLRTSLSGQHPAVSFSSPSRPQPATAQPLSPSSTSLRQPLGAPPQPVEAPTTPSPPVPTLRSSMSGQPVRSSTSLPAQSATSLPGGASATSLPGQSAISLPGGPSGTSLPGQSAVSLPPDKTQPRSAAGTTAERGGTQGSVSPIWFLVVGGMLLVLLILLYVLW